MQIIELELDPGHRISATAVFDNWIDEGISDEKAITKSGPSPQGVFEKLLKPGKKKLSHEFNSLKYFTNSNNVRRRVAFAAPIERQILPIHLTESDGNFLCHKGAFICTDSGIEVVSTLDDRLVPNLLNSPKSDWLGFRGDGIIFVHVGGVFKNKRLQNRVLELDQRSIVGFAGGLSYDRSVAGAIMTNRSDTKAYFKGKLCGSGTVYLQSKPYKMPKHARSLTRDIRELANSKALELYNGNIQIIKSVKWSKLQDLVNIGGWKNRLKNKIIRPEKMA